MTRLKAKSTLLFGFAFILLINVSLSIIYNFHEPSQLRIRKAYKDFYKGYKDVDEYRIHNIYEKDDLRSRLAKAFPYQKSTDPLDKKIWQLWKTKIVKELDKGLQDFVATFQRQADEEKGAYEYTLFANSEQSDMVKRMFASVPEVHQAYDALPRVILQADFMRYLVILAEGGAYSDIDTSLNADMQDWITYNDTVFGKPNQIGCVVGIESDRDEKDWHRNFMPRRLQFCQWTLQAKRGHPIYRELIARITEVTLNQYNNETGDVTVGPNTFNINPDSPSRQSAVLEWTGPAMFTDVVFDYINEVYQLNEKLFGVDFPKDKMVDPNRPLNLLSKVRYHKLRGSNHNEYNPETYPIGWQNFTKQEHPILIDDDLLMLPHRYFGGKMGEKDDYTQHHFKGSWKT
jgi:alpha 1,6-mannosyltransferase